MKRQQEAKAPYLSKGWLDNFLNLIKRVKLVEFKSSTVKQYHLTAPGNESKLVRAVRFLGLIDDQGVIDENTITKLKMEGESYKNALTELVKTAYKEVFDSLSVENAAASDLRNYFVGKYSYSQRQATDAAIIFAFLCKKSGITISPDISSLDKQKGRFDSSKVGQKQASNVNKQKNIVKQESEPAQPFVSQSSNYVASFQGPNVNLTRKIVTKKDLDKFIETVRLNCEFEE